jgi:hypothetical protein
MGRVHVARDLQFGREIALKELGDAASSSEGARRFVIEALVTGNLEHPGIPAVYERGVREGRPFYAMRRIEGRPLTQAIAECKTLEARIGLLPAVVQVANTLGFAHAHGVVHRDIKPDNVLVAAHGEVVVVDWGIAKVRGSDLTGVIESGGEPRGGDAGPEATLHGSVLGTPAYMSPEQARGDVASIDARTDVFAVGALLYHLFAGKPPYEGPTSIALLAAALEGRREPLSRVAPELPPALVAIVDKAMASAPSDRYADAHELAAALQSFMTGAVTQRASPLARVVIAVVTTIVLLGAAFGTFAVLREMPGLELQGGPAILYSLLAASGFVLLATEWITKGQHRLIPLVLAIAAATFLVGLSGTFAGLAVVAQHAGEALVPASPGAPAGDATALFLEGLWECSGSAAGASQLAALLLLASAVTARVRGALPEPRRA